MVIQEQGLLSRLLLVDGFHCNGIPPEYGGWVLDLGPLELVR